MLFAYPIAATVDNWLHECFCVILEAIHSNLANGTSVTEWIEVIPIPYRKPLESRLKGHGKLGDKLNSYQAALEELSFVEQNQILKSFNDQNKIALLLSCQCECEAITDLPLAIRKPAEALFKYAFGLLEDLEIRKQHYQIIYNNIPNRVCPFCGDENFSPLGSQGSRREALDHYLLKDSYPFAAANLLNLVPMGYKCNSQYKNTKDVLYKTDGTRRKCFNPYGDKTIMVSLDNSQPFAGTHGKMRDPLPRWKIDFNSNSEEVDTWNEIFHIQDRYANILDDEFKSWLEIFGKKCNRRNYPTSNQELIDALKYYAEDQELEKFGDRAFLKAAVFRMLHIHCQKGNQRLIKFIRDVVTDASV
jgi:hypothetical protein